MKKLYYKLKISTKISLSFIFIIIIFALSFSYVTIHREKKTIKQETENRARILGETLSQNLAPALYERNITTLDQSRENLEKFPDITYFAVFDNQGKCLVSTEVKEEGSFLKEAKILPSLKIKKKNRKEFMELLQPIKSDDINLGFIKMRFSLNLMHTQIKEAINHTIYLTILFLFIGIILSHLLSFIILRPIHYLLQAIGRMTRGDYQSKVKIDSLDELGVLSQAFNQMVIRLREHKYLWEDKMEKLFTLNLIGRTLTSNLELEYLLPIVLDKVAEVMKAKEVLLMLWEEETNSLKVKGVKGIEPAHLSSLNFRLGEGIAGWVAEKGEPLILNQPSQDPRFKKLRAQDEKISSLLCVPLKTAEKMVGVISVARYEKDVPFTDEDLEFFNTLSHPIAISLWNAHLYQLAITDELTKLYIYRYFKIRLEQEMKRAHRYSLPLSLMMLDIDHFKKVNDNFGHPCGDEILRQIATILRENVRQVDIACRYGGEEFAIILTNTSLSGAFSLGERLRGAIESFPFSYKDIRLQVTVSAGVVEMDKKFHYGDELIKAADNALYQAKREGRNRVVSAKGR